MIANESFQELFMSPGHWEFEIFLMILFDFIFGFLIWQKLIKPHIHRDIKHAEHDHELHEEVLHETEESLSERVTRLEERIAKYEKEEQEARVSIRD